MSTISSSACAHSSICYTSSRHARAVGFKQAGRAERLAAANAEGARPREKPCLDDTPKIFPPPLVLPDDDLGEDPESPPQSFQEWLDGDWRNPVTAKRRTIYVAPAPLISDQVRFMKSWSDPHGVRRDEQTPSPKLSDICDYLGAFYHGLPVKDLRQSPLQFVPWEEGKKKSTASKEEPSYVGLKTSKECVRIRTRPCPDGIYPRQLNLDDLLDVAISMLPKDAYALLLLVDYDLYEDEEDTFVCGRAYGGSRVAVVSSARYNPDLDELQSIERVHAWPMSHCADYISAFCSTSMPKAKRQKKSGTTKTSQPGPQDDWTESLSTPLGAAFSISRSLSESSLSQQSLTALWLGRICRTTSHEVGHCFGIDHCSYYACCMQGTASICEDARQPPYLCPVDQAKLLYVTELPEDQRNQALLSFCERPEFIETHFFAPFAAWLRARLS